MRHKPTCEVLKSPDGRDYFPDTHLYLSFYSESGCTLTIFVKFADQEEDLKAVRSKFKRSLKKDE